MQVLIVVGTRPEAIKLAPVIFALRSNPRFDVRICLTGQHRELLEQALADFGIRADYNLDLMEAGQSISGLVAKALVAISAVLNEWQPDWVIVQGDTSSALAAAQAAFHGKIRVAHVEAGLRTGDPSQPWPEEINRRLIAQLATLHFAPTQTARSNLEREGIAPSRIVVCGNTVIDALKLALDRIPANDQPQTAPMVLVTLHRRENQEPGRLAGVEAALKALAAEQGCEVVFAYHPNPALADLVNRLLDFHPRLRMIPPQGYLSFVGLMSRATLLLTDSGGIQEEAAFLGKPVLIMRQRTERPEVLEGGAILVGTEPAAILAAVGQILENPGRFARPRGQMQAFGNGGAAGLIAEALLRAHEGGL